MYTPVHPRFISRFGFGGGICLLIAPVPVHCFSITFTILKWDVRGYTSHGHVILMEGNDSTSEV